MGCGVRIRESFLDLGVPVGSYSDMDVDRDVITFFRRKTLSIPAFPITTSTCPTPFTIRQARPSIPVRVPRLATRISTSPACSRSPRTKTRATLPLRLPSCVATCGVRGRSSSRLSRIGRHGVPRAGSRSTRLQERLFIAETNRDPAAGAPVGQIRRRPAPHNRPAAHGGAYHGLDSQRADVGAHGCRHCAIGVRSLPRQASASRFVCFRGGTEIRP